MRLFFAFLLFLFAVSTWPFLVFSQVGQEVEVSGGGEEIFVGSIITRSRLTGRFSLANLPGTEEIFGVMSDSAPVSFRQRDGEGVVVLQSGQTVVSVTDLNGRIAVGDYVTSSRIPGYGQKASADHAYIVGVALEPFDSSLATSFADLDGSRIDSGNILVSLDIRPQVLSDNLASLSRDNQTNLALAGQVESYLVMIARYLSALIIALGSIYLSFKFFQVNVSGGLPAMSRNPLAQKPNKQIILLHVAVTILISMAGLALSIFILLLPIFID